MVIEKIMKEYNKNYEIVDCIKELYSTVCQATNPKYSACHEDLAKKLTHWNRISVNELPQDARACGKSSMDAITFLDTQRLFLRKCR